MEKYRVKTIEVMGRKRLRMELPKELDIISLLLTFDVQSKSTLVCKALDRVLNGKRDQEIVQGNVCKVEITKTKTKVYDNLSLKDKNWCLIDTEELNSLIHYWLSELQKFNKETLNKYVYWQSDDIPSYIVRQRNNTFEDYKKNRGWRENPERFDIISGVDPYYTQISEDKAMGIIIGLECKGRKVT